MNEQREQQEHPARVWWRRVCDPEKGDPGARARLRRCREANEVLSVPAGILLARMLGDLPERGVDRDSAFERSLDLARVLARVTADSREHPMRNVGWPAFPGSRKEAEPSEKPRLSEARFRRLLQAEDGPDLVAQFSRLVQLMGGQADVGRIADAFRYWTHPSGRTPREWAFEYYNAGAAFRSTDENTEDSAA